MVIPQLVTIVRYNHHHDHLTRKPEYDSSELKKKQKF